MPLLSLFRSLADGIAGTTGAAVASQLPEFVQQYLQRLGGHRDEALRMVATLKSQGSTVSDALLASAMERAASLTQAFEQIAAASAVARPVLFARHLDPEIARGTWSMFQPAVPLTSAGLVYALIGIVLGLLLLHLFAVPFKLLRRRRAHP
jgi:hypothetical protein